MENIKEIINQLSIVSPDSDWDREPSTKEYLTTIIQNQSTLLDALKLVSSQIEDSKNEMFVPVNGALGWRKNTIELYDNIRYVNLKSYERITTADEDMLKQGYNGKCYAILLKLDNDNTDVAGFWDKDKRDRLFERITNRNVYETKMG